VIKTHKRGTSESQEIYRGKDYNGAEGRGTGAKIADLCCKYCMSDASYYNSKARYAGMNVSDLRKLKTQLFLLPF